MSGKQLSELIQASYLANQHFKTEWNKTTTGKSNHSEQLRVAKARQNFWHAHNRLFSESLDPMRIAFSADPVGTVDEVIDFLAIDVPAYRVSYEKEWYLGKLKSVQLTDEQKARLKVIALDIVSRGVYRRELRDWTRLMTVLADDLFVAELRVLSDSSAHFVQQNARRMLFAILTNRRDLSPIE